jgi:V-type H+-transporting ATPase subunit C
MSQYWLIAVPNENKNEQATRGKLAARTKQFCDVRAFSLPTLKVGTLDALVQLSDETSKIDAFLEQTSKKLERTASDLVRSAPDANSASGGASTTASKGPAPMVELKINDMSPDDYIQRWQWDEKRYSSKNRSIGQLTDGIYKDALKADEELKIKMAEFNDLKSNLLASERKETGSLLVKPLGPYIKKSDIIETEHLTTLFIVVPKNKEQEFVASYETLEDQFAEREAEKAKEKEQRQKERDEARQAKAAKVAAEWEKNKKEKEAKDEKSNNPEEEKKREDDRKRREEDEKKKEEEERAEEEKKRAEEALREVKRKATKRNVVPRSAIKISTPAEKGEEEDEFVLYRVIVFNKGADSYRNMCREKRYTIRPFKYDPEDDKSQLDKKKAMEKKMQHQYGYLVNFAKTAYSDLFAAWIHVKAMRLFVEAVLRYGLPIDFNASLIKPRKDLQKKLRDALQELYGKLAGDPSLTQQLESGETDLSGTGADFYPYVYLTITLTE